MRNSTIVDKFHSEFDVMAHIGGMTHFVVDQKSSTHVKKCYINQSCGSNEFTLKFDSKSEFKYPNTPFFQDFLKMFSVDVLCQSLKPNR